MPVVIVGNLRHWNYYVFRVCRGFRIACETRFSLTWSGFLYSISLNNDTFASSSLPCFSFLLSLISDTMPNINIQSQNTEVYQGLLYELELYPRCSLTIKVQWFQIFQSEHLFIYYLYINVFHCIPQKGMHERVISWVERWYNSFLRVAVGYWVEASFMCCEVNYL